MRYLAFNPVRAGLADRPQDWPWSSVTAHLEGHDDALVRVQPALDIAPKFAELLDLSIDELAALDAFETLAVNDRALGSADVLAEAERRLGRG